jgi:hypothetical protein
VTAKLVRRDQFLGSGPVRYKIETGSDGRISAKLAIDYAEAPVPLHYYVADYFEVANLDPRVLFVFGKLNYPDRTRLRNKLEIDFPALLFIAQFWKSRAQFQETLRAFNRQLGYEPVRSGNISEAVDKVQTIHSNNALMILSGGECMIDFFYLSPRDLSLKAPKGHDIALEPLVRVITAPDLLLGFLDACEPIAESLMRKFGGDEGEDEALES